MLCPVVMGLWGVGLEHPEGAFDYGTDMSAMKRQGPSVW